MYLPAFVLIVCSFIIYVDSFRVIHGRKVNDSATNSVLIHNRNIKNKTKEIKNVNTRKSMNYNKSGRKMAYRAVKTENKMAQRSFNADNPVYRNSESQRAGEQTLESVVLSLNSGIKKILQQNNIQPNFLDGYAQQVIDFFKMNAGPMFRAAESKYKIKPEIVHFRSEKPTVKFEINAQSMVALLKDMLKSETFNENLDHLVKQAGLIFRTIQDGSFDKHK